MVDNQNPCLAPLSGFIPYPFLDMGDCRIVQVTTVPPAVPGSTLKDAPIEVAR